MKNFFQQILQAWPIIIVIIGAVWSSIAFMGEKYMEDIAKKVYDEQVSAEPIIASIKTDLEVLKNKADNANITREELKASINKLDDNIQQLIRIMLTES